MNQECFLGIEGHAALDINLGLGYNILFLRLIQGDPYVPINSTKHIPAFHTVWLHCQNSKAWLPTCQAGRQFASMSDREPTRWQHNRIYPPFHRSLHVYVRFDLPFTNFHIDYESEIVLTVVKLIALNLCD